MIEAGKFLLLISSTLIVSYVSGLIYTKTKIPDIVWLLGYGVLLGPVLGLFDREFFIAVSPIIGVVSICVITFGSAIEIDINILMDILPKSVVLTLSSFFSIVISVGMAMRFLMPTRFTLLEGMLLGTMVAGISTVAIISLLQGMSKLIPDIKEVGATLLLESTIVDPFRIVIAITIIRMLLLSRTFISRSLRNITFTFIASSVMGALMGFLWAIILDRLRGKAYNYMLTLSSLFPLYFVVEEFAGDGGGTIAIFVFGLVLANHRFFARKFGADRRLRLDKNQIKRFNAESTFFLKSYYFVYIGLTVTLAKEYMIVGVGIALLIIGIRYVVGTIMGNILRFSRKELMVSRLTFTLGTSTLIMSQLPLIYDQARLYFTNPEIYPDLCFPIVLCTVLFSAIAGPMIATKQLENEISKKESEY